MKSKIALFLQNIFLLLSSLIFMLIIVEIFLRFFPFDENKTMVEKQLYLKRDNEFIFYEYDRYLGWKNKPFAEGYFTMPDSKTFVRINSNGLRDREYPYKKREGVLRILVLGDSFTWGYGVELEEIFTERLETMFGENVEVLNAGVTGYGTDQELIFLEKEGVRYKPDIILVAFADNDFMWDNRVDKHGQYLKPLFGIDDGNLKPLNIPLPELSEWDLVKLNDNTDEGAKDNTERLDIKSFLRKKTRIYPFISKSSNELKYGLLRNMAKNPKTSGILHRLRTFFNTDMENIKVTKALFLRMKECAEGIGAKVVIFIVPYKCALEKLPNPFIDEFIEFFEKEKIPCLFPYKRFLDEFQKGEKLYLSYDDHWSPKGHSLSAEEMYNFLKREGLVQISNFK